MRRRTLMKLAGAGLLAAPAIVRAEADRVLKFIPQADVAVLDPIWTTAYVTRNHAMMLFDTLFGQDAAYKAQPQMAEGLASDDGGKQVRITLRPGPLFHDNTPVLARDCVASIRRWGRRDAFGSALLAATDELSAPDDRTILFRLKAPFPVADALGKVGPNFCAIMPERLAATDAFKQVTEMVGSGPFRFLADERVSGAHVGYRRFEGYKPREGGVAEWTAGPKVAHFDKVDWNVIPDAATASAALQRGEADWWEKLDFDLKPMLARDPNLQIFVVESTGNIGFLRMNQLFPPFDNPAIRRALLGAVKQSDYMHAVAGDDHANWRDDVGFFTPDTPMASQAGLSALTGPRDLGKVKAELKAAGYNNERIAVMVASDFPTLAALGNVGADMLQRCGMNVDLQTTDWGTIVQRRASKAPLNQNGWSVFFSTFTGLDAANPAVSLGLRGNGAEAWFGWPNAPKLEALRSQWLATPDQAQQKVITEQEQIQAFTDVPYLPLGQYFQSSAQRKTLTGTLKGLPLFWNVRRA
jgi:peptide/nickel transport system substrate-binding protein